MKGLGTVSIYRFSQKINFSESKHLKNSIKIHSKL